jgi:serine/threonine protein kinase
MNVSKLNDQYYYYKEPIGYGSFSIIYKGYSIHSSIPIAIKRITKIIDMKYFHNEVDLMKQLDHPNILKLYDVVKTNGNIYLILEYCKGGDLSKYISSSIQTSVDIKYFKQIFIGLEYLYLHNILHRDIKPHNILIHDGQIKISDFGFAKAFEKNELITTFCGSPLYMAPEIIKTKEYDFKSDIWSLGVIIYELIAKKHPYYVDSKKVLWDKIKNGLDIDYSTLKHSNITPIIRRMLIENPYTRINWDELFVLFHHTTFEECETDVEQDMMFSMDLGDHDSMETHSVIIPKKQSNIMLSHSVNLQNFDNSLILENEDYKLISRSAPHMSRSYLENYIKDKTTPDVDSVPILGSEPRQQDSMVHSIVDKSLKTVKHFFGYY